MYVPNWIKQGLFKDLTANIDAMPFKDSINKGHLAAGTAAGGWRVKTFKWFQEAYPQARSAGSLVVLAVGLAFLIKWALDRGTGSLYAVRNVHKQLVNDDEWFTMNVLVRRPRAWPAWRPTSAGDCGSGDCGCRLKQERPTPLVSHHPRRVRPTGVRAC